MDKKYNQIHDAYLFDSSSPSTSYPNSPSSQSSQKQFIQKLVEILDDRTNSEYIFWNRAGTSVIIRDIEAFSQNVLPKYGFKTTNYNSFIRQLNMYNFHKVKNANSRGTRGEDKYLEFKNENFIRDKPHLRANIKRKSNEKDNEIQVMYFELQNSYNQLFSYVNNLKQKLEEVDRDNHNLKKMIEILKKYIDKRFEDISGKAPNNLNTSDNEYPDSEITSPNMKSPNIIKEETINQKPNDISSKTSNDLLNVSDNKYSDNKYSDSKYSNNKYSDSKYSDNKYPNNEYLDNENILPHMKSSNINNNKNINSQSNRQDNLSFNPNNSDSENNPFEF